MKRKKSHPHRIVLFLILSMACNITFAQENRIDKGSTDSGILFPIRLFRNVLSGADGDRCPMYPSCSQYCISAARKHGFIKGWIMSCDRLLRCGRDEIKRSDAILLNGEKRCYDPVSHNDFWWYQP